MARFRHIQNNFLSGEISPTSFARTELREYQEACEELENFIVKKNGGASRRVGSEFLTGELTAGTDIPSQTRCIPFVVSKEEFFIILVPPDSVNIYIYDPKHKSTTTLTQSVTLGPMQEHTSPEAFHYKPNEMSEIQYIQSGKRLWLLHQNHAPRIISKDQFSGTTWSLRNFRDNSNDIEKFPFQDLNANTAVVMTSSATTGTVTLTSAVSFFDTGGKDTGKVFAFIDSGVVGHLFLTTPISATQHSASVLSTLPAAMTGAGTADWHQGAWSLDDGFPKTASFFEQRLIYAGTEGFPDTLWGSQVGDVYELVDTDTTILGTGSVTNSDAFKFTLASNEVNDIQWMTADKNLVIGTSGREYIASGADSSLGLGPLNVGFSAETSHGSDFVQGIRSENVTIFVQRGGRQLREFVFNRDENSFRSLELTNLVDHIVEKSISLRAGRFDSRIITILNQETPNGSIWMLDSNGFLFTTTRRRLLEVNAFSNVRLGGAFKSEDPYIYSLTSAPSIDSKSDDVYVVVGRTVNGSTQVSLERISSEPSDDIYNSSSWFNDKIPYVDSALLRKCNDLPTLRATYTVDEDADISGGSPTGTLAGGASVSGGKLVLPAGATCTYSPTSNAILAQDFSINIKYEPITIAAGTDIIFNFFGAAGANEVDLSLDSTGVFRVRLRDKLGALIINNIAFPEFDINVNTIYEIELMVNLSNRVVRLFVNGIQWGSDVIIEESVSVDRDTGVVTSIQVGAPGTAQAFNVDEFTVYQGVQNFTNYRPQDFFQSTTAIDGFDHLEGETVDVIADDIYIGQKTVSSGGFTLDTAACEVIAGLPYTSTIKTLRIEAGSNLGNAQGAIKRIDEAVIRLYKSLGAKVGDAEDDLDEIVFRDATVPMGDPTPLFTGDKLLKMPSDYDRKGQVVVQQTDPFPLHVLGIIMRGITYD